MPKENFAANSNEKLAPVVPSSQALDALNNDLARMKATDYRDFNFEVSNQLESTDRACVADALEAVQAAGAAEHAEGAVRSYTGKLVELTRATAILDEILTGDEVASVIKTIADFRDAVYELASAEEREQARKALAEEGITLDTLGHVRAD